MNEITLTGNLGAAPKLVDSKAEKTTIVTFSIGINDGYYDRNKGEWKNRPTVWQNVIVFGELATRTYDSLATDEKGGKGVMVTVTGTLSDDSWTRPARDEGGEDIMMRRTKLIARDVAVSLARATVAITRITREDTDRAAAAA